MRLPRFIRDRLFDLAVRVSLARPHDFTVAGDGGDYLRRWWVVPRNPVFNIYLHQFLHSDDDRALHDHPWWNVSLLIVGHYTEHTIAAGGVNQRRIYRAGDVKFRGARSAHRIEIADPCWTIFVTGPTLREWGFHCPQGWRHWRLFTDQRDKGKIGRGCA